jgi:hypothetical protein
MFWKNMLYMSSLLKSELNVEESSSYLGEDDQYKDCGHCILREDVVGRRMWGWQGSWVRGNEHK